MDGIGSIFSGIDMTEVTNPLEKFWECNGWAITGGKRQQPHQKFFGLCMNG